MDTAGILRKRLSDLFSDDVLQICECFEVYGYQVRIVGGAVRDVLVGRIPKDIDLATDCPEAEFERICAGLRTKYMHNANSGDSLTVLQIYFEGRPYELVPLRPLENIVGDLWLRDAAGRDFTFNAMSASRDGELYDYFGGAEDLKQHRVRWIGSIHDRIAEAPFRILRYFRFHCEMQSWCNGAQQVAPHDPSVLSEMAAEKALLQSVHGQVVWKLLKQVICGSRHAVDGEIKIMYEYGFLAEVLPYDVDLEQAREIRRFQDQCEYVSDIAVEPVTTLAALLRWNAKQLNAASVALRWSVAESSLGKLLCSVHCSDPTPSLQDCFAELWIEDGFKWRRNVHAPDPTCIAQAKGWLHQLLISQGLCADLDLVSSLTVPELPIELPALQRFLVSHTGVGADGKVVMLILKELRQTWVAGGCQSAGNQLIEEWWSISRTMADCKSKDSKCVAGDPSDLELQSYDELYTAICCYIHNIS